MIEYVALVLCGVIFGFTLGYKFSSIDLEKAKAEKRSVFNKYNTEYLEMCRNADRANKQIEILQGISDSNAKKLIHANEQVRIQNDIIAQLRSELEKAKKNDARHPKGAKDKDGNSIGGQYAGKKVK